MWNRQMNIHSTYRQTDVFVIAKAKLLHSKLGLRHAKTKLQGVQVADDLRSTTQNNTNLTTGLSRHQQSLHTNIWATINQNTGPIYDKHSFYQQNQQWHCFYSRNLFRLMAFTICDTVISTHSLTQSWKKTNILQHWQLDTMYNSSQM